jgi:ABC-type lipoprotein export system ATPase subunit
MTPHLVVRDLVVEYVHDGYAVRPLDGLSFEGHAGELVVLLGPSGCGKTTLLSALGGILTPTSGTIELGDVVVTSLRGRALDQHRRERVGFVFQAFNLIPSPIGSCAWCQSRRPTQPRAALGGWRRATCCSVRATHPTSCT